VPQVSLLRPGILLVKVNPYGDPLVSFLLAVLSAMLRTIARLRKVTVSIFEHCILVPVA